MLCLELVILGFTDAGKSLKTIIHPKEWDLKGYAPVPRISKIRTRIALIVSGICFLSY